MYCGLRVGELVALPWDDVNLVNRRKQVQRRLQRLKHGQGIIFGEPKSSRGRRQFVLPTAVTSAFRRWRIRQKEERPVARVRGTDTWYV